MDLESRIRNFIFGWDMYNFIIDDNVDEKLEDVLEAISENNIRNIELNHNLLKNWKDNEISDGDICKEIASYLKEQGNHLIIIESPIPRNIVKDGDNYKSWSSSFGFCRVTVMMINSFETIREKIKELEEKIMEEEYQKQINKIA